MRKTQRRARAKAKRAGRVTYEQVMFWELFFLVVALYAEDAARKLADE